MSFEEIKSLTTTSKKTLNFYNKYKNFDFAQMNDMMIDLFENLINNISGEMNNSLTKDLLLMIKEQNHNIITLKTDIVMKMYDIKKENMDDLKILIGKNDNENILKIMEKVEKENSKLIEEIIPKSNSQYYIQLREQYDTLRTELINNNNHDNLEIKYNNLIKSIESSLITYISKSEDRIQNNISEIKNNDMKTNEIQQKINEDLIKYLDKYKNSSQKGNISENHIENLLNSLYKSAEIKRTTDTSRSGDFIMTQNNISILFEIKNYNVNIPTHEVTKFIRDVNEQNMCGIMISISTGISNKQNYQIDITENNNICLYIHDMNYDQDKLKLGVDIIENLHLKLLKCNVIETGGHKISNDVLELINKEYQAFIQKRDIAINNIKDLSKKTIQYIEELELMNLNKLLTSKYSFNNTSTLECELCKKFVGTNLKSLAAHKRKCKNNQKLNQETNQDINEITNESSSDTSLDTPNKPNTKKK